MAKPAIKDDLIYKVTLTRSIPVGRSIVHPGPNVVLRGDTLKAIVAANDKAVSAYEPKS